MEWIKESFISKAEWNILNVLVPLNWQPGETKYYFFNENIEMTSAAWTPIFFSWDFSEFLSVEMLRFQHFMKKNKLNTRFSERQNPRISFSSNCSFYSGLEMAETDGWMSAGETKRLDK